MKPSRFEARWAPHFADQPELLAAHVAQYEEAYERDHDEEGYPQSGAIERSFYLVAKALGKDTTQVCPRCHKTRDEVACFDDKLYGERCAACMEELEAERQAEHQREVEAAAARKAAYDAMTPEERALVDREVKICLAGLFRRDVQ